MPPDQLSSGRQYTVAIPRLQSSGDDVAVSQRLLPFLLPFLQTEAGIGGREAETDAR
jgi:hypothetical protein